MNNHSLLTLHEIHDYKDVCPIILLHLLFKPKYFVTLKHCFAVCPDPHHLCHIPVHIPGRLKCALLLSKGCVVKEGGSPGVPQHHLCSGQQGTGWPSAPGVPKLRGTDSLRCPFPYLSYFLMSWLSLGGQCVSCGHAMHLDSINLKKFSSWSLHQ